MSNVQIGRYRHYKGKEYTVIGVALHSRTEEELVVYPVPVGAVAFIIGWVLMAIGALGLGTEVRKTMTKFVQSTFAVVVLAAAAFAEPPRPLEFRTIALNSETGGMLAVVDGQPWLVVSGSALTEWTLQETDKGWTIQGRLSQEKPDLRFLSIDAKGKVTLVSELGDGAYWKLTRKGDGMNGFDATIQASGGKFNGWYLDFSERQEQIGKNRFKHEAYRVKVSEKPGPRTNLNIFIDGP